VVANMAPKMQRNAASKKRGGKSNSSTSLSRSKSFSHGIEVETKKRKGSRPAVTAAKKMKPTIAAQVETSPYAGFERPTPADVTQLHTALAKHFGERRCLHDPSSKRAKRPILGTVVGTILSQNTTNTNSHRAFTQLMDKFGGSWDAVRTAKPSSVEAAIKCGGLAPKKTKWIQHILKTVKKESGKTSMEYLRNYIKEGVHKDLERFTGIGKKTSAIINLFDVGHPDMAVDTHVFRYCLQLGWVPTDKERAKHNKSANRKDYWPVITRDTVYAHLDSRHPDKLKYSMHLILTDTVGGLPVVCGARNELAFNGSTVSVDGKPLTKLDLKKLKKS